MKKKIPILPIAFIVGFLLYRIRQGNAVGKIEDTSRLKGGSKVDRYWGELQPLNYFGSRGVDKFEKYYDPESVVEEFDLYGIEFGNWMNQQDRINHLVGMAVGFKDLARVIGVAKSKVGFGGELQMSLGSRGVPNSKAHYMPGLVYINMNKVDGANSLAHEYAHAIDFYLSRKYYEKIESAAGGSSVRKQSELSMMAKDNSPIYLFEKLFDRLYYDGEEPTDFYYEMKKQTKYFASRVEIWARTFEKYVSLELAKKRITNTYLAKSNPSGAVYPSEELIKKVTPTIKQIIAITFR